MITYELKLKYVRFVLLSYFKLNTNYRFGDKNVNSEFVVSTKFIVYSVKLCTNNKYPKMFSM